MSNDLSTLSGALLEMKDELIYQLGQKGVTASYSSTDGLLGLIGRIADIQTGGGGSYYHIEFNQSSYNTIGTATVSVTVLKNYSVCVGETVTFTSDASTTTTATTDSNGVATATIIFSDTATLTASISNVSDTATINYINIPSQYVQVEYLQSNGANGINTGYILQANDIVEVKFNSQASAPYESIFGARNKNNDFNSYVLFCRFAYLHRMNYGRTRSETNGQTTISTNTIYTAITNQRTCDVYNEDGTLNHTITNTDGTIENCINPCGLFTLNTYNGTGYQKDTQSHMKIYYFKITDENGVLKRHMLPVRDGTTGGMYDLVTEQFYGDASGVTFLYGSDV